jgi:hypothetical protein
VGNNQNSGNMEMWRRHVLQFGGQRVRKEMAGGV